VLRMRGKSNKCVILEAGSVVLSSLHKLSIWLDKNGMAYIVNSIASFYYKSTN